MTVRLTVPHVPLVLVVDDIAANRELLEGHLIDLGHEVMQAEDGAEALALIEEREPDLVLLDVMMPKIDGITVCRRIKADPVRRLIPVVLITAANDHDTRLRGLDAGADDFLTKPVDAKELLVRTRVLLHERALNTRLDATDEVLRAFARTVEARDLHTIHHAERVGRYAEEVGHALGMSREDLATLRMGGVLHDLGKIAIPDAILLKRGPLSADELEVMRTHSVQGERILGALRTVAQFLPIIRHHHERVDGRGYPDHLAGTDIPLSARIAAVADAWDAMLSDRPYRTALDIEEARRRLLDGAGTQWDGDLVGIFADLIDGGVTGRIAVAA